MQAVLSGLPAPQTTAGPVCCRWQKQAAVGMRSGPHQLLIGESKRPESPVSLTPIAARTISFRIRLLTFSPPAASPRGGFPSGFRPAARAAFASQSNFSRARGAIQEQGGGAIQGQGGGAIQEQGDCDSFPARFQQLAEPTATESRPPSRSGCKIGQQ